MRGLVLTASVTAWIEELALHRGRTHIARARTSGTEIAGTQRKRGADMFAFIESVEVEADSQKVWLVMVDVEHWWPRSNPDHIMLELLDREPLTLGSRLRIKERVAGIPADATGSITEFDEGARVTWDAVATYRLLGVPLTVQEGVTWTIEARSATVTTISARVWAVLPLDRLATALFRAVGGVKKDRAHTRTELVYLKRLLEEAAER